MINKNTLYNLDDVAIMPASESNIEHRSECNTYYLNEFNNSTLPIFTAPMPCVINKKTLNLFLINNITPIIPRTEDYFYRFNSCKYYWCAFSLQEFKEAFCNEYDMSSYKRYVLIDIANGNMADLMNSIKKAKEIHGENIVIMAGNIANPLTYEKLSLCGADYVRLSVGSGTGCTSATNLGIFYPMASLIDECYYIKTHSKDCKCAKIIADGGLSNYRNMIKALALGADYIMLGSALNKCSDSAGEIVKTEDGKYKKLYYGMASNVGQEMLRKGKELKTPEGKVVYNDINGTISEFKTDFISYLTSAMSYCNINDINKFIGKPELNLISFNSSKQFNQYQ